MPRFRLAEEVIEDAAAHPARVEADDAAGLARAVLVRLVSTLKQQCAITNEEGDRILEVRRSLDKRVKRLHSYTCPSASPLRRQTSWCL